MKRIFIAISIVLVGIGMVIEKHSNNSTKELSKLQMANIEALSGDENPCPNVHMSGYRQWSNSGFLRTEKSFRDCCGMPQTGYNPKGTCIR